MGVQVREPPRDVRRGHAGTHLLGRALQRRRPRGSVARSRCLGVMAAARLPSVRGGGRGGEKSGVATASWRPIRGEEAEETAAKRSFAVDLSGEALCGGGTRRRRR